MSGLCVSTAGDSFGDKGIFVTKVTNPGPPPDAVRDRQLSPACWQLQEIYQERPSGTYISGLQISAGHPGNGWPEG